MRQLTKHEIIDEIAGLYNSNTRSMGLMIDDPDCDPNVPVCKYNGDGGRTCAFGHMVEETSRHKLIEGKTAKSLIENGKIQLYDLKEQYRGHSERFYQDIQHLHDRATNWNGTGLSELGQRTVKRLKELWPK